MQVKNRLKLLRTQAGMTVADLSRETGIPVSSISRQENLTRTITTEAAITYCDYFGCSMDYFFCRENNERLFDKYSNMELKDFIGVVDTELKRRKAE